ncbi:UDP-N-acetylmuramoyl-tripeptide--D-alanyl-D-alanine ligase [Bifidobacterium choloepi]|uniref:UDP-N-acetylmuramoyl-tripeptide--D-alanyl-D-alanine ligase n=1 Tax=Bifidobacterium choloepi TaxID=2614131 RepID=A0A6I5N0Q4_9BIFI|nr:UDP-N-acetylmuramoyl-tripeptide--D-alanyl-D-alanine ligase [Bifidobacterium choloepi]NEG70046.1 UDP-N-acetylmuramoyl-tripeptide--D-alanyl-D-alanine ligase [Bifidobacterium choloepi]
MMPMTLAEVAEATGGRLVGAPATDEAVALHVTTDSRDVVPGTVFVAIAGEHVDGHDYVARAAGLGAVAAIVDHEVAPGDVDGQAAAPIAQVVVDDTVDALGRLARHNIDRRRALAAASVDADGEESRPFAVIGITGSVGKTTTKDLLNALLSRAGETVAPVGSFNNEIGMPLTALKVGPTTRFLVSEMGASHVGEIARLTGIAAPDVAVVLKVGNAHLGEFGSVERIAEAKSEIVRGERPDGVTILNADDGHVAAMAELAPSFVKWFGVEHAADHDDYFSADHIALDPLGRPVFTIRMADGAYETLTLGIPGRHNVMNVLAAASVASYFGMGLKEIVDVLASVSHISPHRMAVSDVTIGDDSHDAADAADEAVPATSFTLIDDSFNANPDSMRAGIDGLVAWRADEDADGTEVAGRPYRIAVLGAMLELGGDEERLHRTIGEYVAGSGVDAVISVGGATDVHLDRLAGALADGATAAAKEAGASLPVYWEHGPAGVDARIAELAAANPGRDVIVLLKGSHASGLSALAEQWAPAR